MPVQTPQCPSDGKRKRLNQLTRAFAVLLLLTSVLRAAEPVPPDDTARFLAGLNLPANSPLSELTANRVWMEYASHFDNAWTQLEAHQLSRIRAWGSENLDEAFTKPSLIYYMFSGPDFLYADAFYPNGSTYVLCGIEPVGSLPDITRVPKERLGAELEDIQRAMNSVLSFGFFITKEMKTTLENHQFNGTLPILYIFLARSGKVVQEVSLVSLDKSGALQADPPSAPAGKGLIPGAKIIFSGTGGGPVQTLYYFCSNISDDGIQENPGFLKFCQSLGPGNSLVKSDSPGLCLYPIPKFNGNGWLFL